MFFVLLIDIIYDSFTPQIGHHLPRIGFPFRIERSNSSVVTSSWRRDDQGRDARGVDETQNRSCKGVHFVTDEESYQRRDRCSCVLRRVHHHHPSPPLRPHLGRNPRRSYRLRSEHHCPFAPIRSPQRDVEQHSA